MSNVDLKILKQRTVAQNSALKMHYNATYGRLMPAKEEPVKRKYAFVLFDDNKAYMKTEVYKETHEFFNPLGQEFEPVSEVATVERVIMQTGYPTSVRFACVTFVETWLRDFAGVFFDESVISTQGYAKEPLAYSISQAVSWHPPSVKKINIAMYRLNRIIENGWINPDTPSRSLYV